MHVLLDPIREIISRVCPKIVVARSQAIGGERDEGMMKVEFLDNLTPRTVGGDITRHAHGGPAGEAE